jgi:hypothetical protein
MKGNGYVPLRRQLVLEHLVGGRMSANQFAAYVVMISLADKRTGMWRGSARALAVYFGAGDVSERTARRLLESLEQKGYVKRFSTRRGHGNYPIAINRYEVTYGAAKGKRLNALKTTNWRRPIFEVGLEGGAQGGAETASVQEERREKRERSRKPAAAIKKNAGKSEAWEALSIKPRNLPPEFCELVEGLYDTKGTMSMSEFVRICMDLWEEQGGKIPPPFAQAAKTIREREKNRPPTPTPAASASTVIGDKEAAGMGVVR